MKAKCRKCKFVWQEEIPIKGDCPQCHTEAIITCPDSREDGWLRKLSEVQQKKIPTRSMVEASRTRKIFKNIPIELFCRCKKCQFVWREMIPHKGDCPRCKSIDFDSNPEYRLKLSEVEASKTPTRIDIETKINEENWSDILRKTKTAFLSNPEFTREAYYHKENNHETIKTT